MSPRDLEPTPGDETPLVRPYALVRGRTRAEAAPALPVEAMIETTQLGTGLRLPLERGAILQRCTSPCSVAELAVHLRVPVGVTRVLVDDLLAVGAVHVHLPAAAHTDGQVDRVLLERVLAGLEAL